MSTVCSQYLCIRASESSHYLEGKYGSIYDGLNPSIINALPSGRATPVDMHTLTTTLRVFHTEPVTFYRLFGGLSNEQLLLTL